MCFYRKILSYKDFVKPNYNPYLNTSALLTHINTEWKSGIKMSREYTALILLLEKWHYFLFPDIHKYVHTQAL